MSPICVKCQRFFHPKQNGMCFIEGMPQTNLTRVGSSCPDQWQPYKLWSGDLYECAGCGAQTIVGVGQRPLAENHEHDFCKKLKEFGAKIQVNDY